MSQHSLASRVVHTKSPNQVGLFNLHKYGIVYVMRSPEIFMPRGRLMVPWREANEVVLEDMRASSHSLQPLPGSELIMKRFFPFYPSWEPWHDDQGGHLQILNTDGEPLSTVTLDPDSREDTPPSTDGYPLHSDRHFVLTFGPCFDDLHAIAWGVLSHSLEDLCASPDDTTILHLQRIGGEDQPLQDWYNSRF